MRLDAAFRRRRRRIGIAPLIDVVFILLLFFMLTTNFTHWRQWPLAVHAEAAAAHPDDDARALRLRADGILRHGERAFAGDGDALRAFVQEAPTDLYVIDAAGVSTQTLVDWLDRLKQAGAKRLSLAESAP